MQAGCPGFADLDVFLASLRFQKFELLRSVDLGRCLVDQLQIGCGNPGVLVRDQLQADTHPMSDSELNLAQGILITMASGKLLGPSTQAIRMYSPSRVLSSVRTETQKLPLLSQPASSDLSDPQLDL